MLLTITKDKRISLNGEHLVIEAVGDGPESDTVPLRLVDRVVVVGNPTITVPVLKAFSKSDIPVTYLSYYGKYIGSFNGVSQGNVQRQRLQFLYERSGSIDFAVEIVKDKIWNQKHALMRFGSNHPDIDIKSEISRLDECLAKCPNATGENTLRGFEGTAARHYFKAFNKFLPEEWRFKARCQHPATDPMNALLSFAYTLTVSELVAAICIHGLNPAVGFLHHNMQNALAYDLVELFRAPLCDIFSLKLVNLKILKLTDFVKNAENGAFYLNDMGRKVFFSNWERMDLTFEGRKIKRLDLFSTQAMAIVHALETRQPPDLYRMK